MDAVFLKLLNMSIAAGWLIMAVIFLRLIFKKAPKWIRCILWAIVAVRLVCPFTIESPLSLIPSAETVSPAVVQYSQKPVINSGVPYINSTLNPAISESFATAPGASANPLQIWMFIASVIWIIGMAAIFGYALVSFLRIHGRVREAVRLRDNVWLCDAVKSPFILGFFRPQIYISSAADDEQLKYILAHEQAHLKRRDHWWKMFGYLLLAVYWFNPLMWVAYILLCRDIELACDEKVIKNMDMDSKKAYSNALVDCSTSRKMIMACPLAFGEISVKARVKSVLNYKKPTFWIVIMAAAACAAAAVCFLTNPREDAFDIKIVIPAGCGQTVHYSNEEISPNRSRVTLSSGEGLGDTKVILLPTEVKEENAYDEFVYMTPGMPVKMNAEKGGWFRIGVFASNPTNEDIIVYVHAEGVTVRIADKAISENTDENRNSDDNDGNEGGDIKEEHDETISFLGMIVESTTDFVGTYILVKPFNDDIPYEHISFRLPEDKEYWGVRINNIVAITCTDSFTGAVEGGSGPIYGELVSIKGVDHINEAVILNAISDRNSSYYPIAYNFECSDFVMLDASASPADGDTSYIITFYGWALYQRYNVTEKGIEDVGGSHIPVALTFDVNEKYCKLTEYWEPGDGSYFEPDIRSKFPTHIADEGIDSQKYIVQQIQDCYSQAVRLTDLDTDAVIGSLIDKICSSPAESSNPYDYIDAHPIEYRELIYYGEYTLRYCLNRFDQGNETGLEGKVMAIVCEELLQTQDKIPENAGTAETGQLWYDTLHAHASNKVKPYIEKMGND